MNFISQIWQFIRTKKKYVFAAIGSALVFTVLLFPLSDIADLVGMQISRATQNQMILQFKGLSLSVAPPGLELDSVNVELRGMSPLSIQQLVLSPSIMSLFSKSPMGSVSAQGIFRGNIDASLRSGADSDNGVPRQKIAIDAENIELQDLLVFTRVPLTAKGLLKFSTSGLVDLTFQEQPEVELEAAGQRIEIPPGNLETPMGPLALPDLRLSQLQLKTKLAGGRLLIDEAKIGGDSDELRGNVKGQINLQLQNFGGRPVPVIGAYSVDVDLTVAKSAGSKYAFFLSFVDRFKTESAAGAQYRFRVSAASPQTVPSLDAVR